MKPATADPLAPQQVGRVLRIEHGRVYRAAELA